MILNVMTEFCNKSLLGKEKIEGENIMAKRTKNQQTIHDNKVSQIARNLKQKGWNVKADLPGYEQPSQISNFLPDIEATKPGTRKIIEVETKDSVVKDKGQISAFNRSASQRNRTTFEVVIADKKKK